MLLSDRDIKEGIKNGSILITPFNEKQLNNVSYDLTVGDTWVKYLHSNSMDKRAIDVRNPKEAFRVKKGGGYDLKPGERILGHSREFAGGTGKLFCEGKVVTSFVQATSTAGRIGLTACLCAGWGDVGYANRWTLEILNVSPYRIFIPVGVVLAQICFELVNVPDKLYGKDTGSYQGASSDARELEADWSPERHMIPRPMKEYPL
jgi:dCTP deaminase